ncbi:hypothetical protein ASPBRDRAFT_238764 [Aspergillus brasiliensis CBS 101740]|uniref:Uncharacterized protein n=1 Tax=Aspergillus brasiliensis (strain CBS 101740 / IMI 381727 / IBT 21946) TaxID=767769 RepID=A0A1L9V0J9_ASPBC|nr:hypothetical protein ASPBRDRAFT_238764 [Aspergillus brasiliensis CBS 101740]
MWWGLLRGDPPAAQSWVFLFYFWSILLGSWPARFEGTEAELIFLPFCECWKMDLTNQIELTVEARLSFNSLSQHHLPRVVILHAVTSHYTRIFDTLGFDERSCDFYVY